MTDHKIVLSYWRKGHERWLDHRGEPVENRLIIDNLEFIYAECYSLRQNKVESDRVDDTMVLGNVVWTAGEGKLTRHFFIPFWSIPNSFASLRDIGEAFQQLTNALAVPAEMFRESIGSIRAASEEAARQWKSTLHFYADSFYSFDGEAMKDWLHNGPTDDDLTELRWQVSPWRTPEDLAWLSPDGGAYEQRYRGGN